MEDESREPLPDEVVVPFVEAREVVVALDDLIDALIAAGDVDSADKVEAVLGRVTRWLWPFLRQLDEEDR